MHKRRLSLPLIKTAEKNGGGWTLSTGGGDYINSEVEAPPWRRDVYLPRCWRRDWLAYYRCCECRSVSPNVKTAKTFHPY